MWVRFDSDSIPIRIGFESDSNPVGFRPKLTLHESTSRSTTDRPTTKTHTPLVPTTHGDLGDQRKAPPFNEPTKSS